MAGERTIAEQEQNVYIAFAAPSSRNEADERLNKKPGEGVRVREHRLRLEAGL